MEETAQKPDKQASQQENPKQNKTIAPSKKKPADSYEEDIRNLECHNHELVNNLQRLQAEFENYKKRIQSEQSDFCKRANEELISELLCVLDNFELALSTNSNNDSFHKGIELVYGNLYAILEKFGLKRISANIFDPRYHEVLLAEESPEEPGKILEEMQAGYIIGGKVLRHTKVKVAKPKTSKNTGN